MRDNRSPSFSPQDDLLDRIEALEVQIKVLNQRATSTVRVTDTTGETDPIEGEQVLDHTDNIHKWYLNGAWHQASESSPGIPIYTPRIPIRCYRGQSATRWPGGVVVVAASGYSVGGALDSPRVGEPYAYQSVSDSQIAADHNAASDTLSFTTEGIGLVPDMPYHVFVGARTTGTPSGDEISFHLDGVYQVRATSVINDTFFGLYWTGAGGQANFTPSAGQTISVRAFRTGGSGDVRIDQIYFIPNGFVPGSTDSIIDYQTTIAFQGTNASHITLPFSHPQAYNTVGRSSQYLDSLQDPAFEWSIWSFEETRVNNGYANDANARYARDLIFHPRHVYLEAGICASAGSVWPAHITFGGDTGIYDSGIVDLSSMGLVYLGLLNPQMHDDMAVALWNHNSANVSTNPFVTGAGAGYTLDVAQMHFVTDDFYSGKHIGIIA